MASKDRLLPLCDILLAAAHADGHLDDREDDVVRALLAELTGGELPVEAELRIANFDPDAFVLSRAVAPFARDSQDDRKHVLYLVDAVLEADDEHDLAESAFLGELARALAVPADQLKGMTLEVEELKQSLAVVRRGPPPIPGQRDDDVDIDLD